MLGFVIIGALAAFGLVCAVWTVIGLFLEDTGGELRYSGPDAVEFARRYLWLREMGLLRCPLRVESAGESERRWLAEHGIELTDGRENIDRRTGDFTGCHQRRDISES